MPPELLEPKKPGKLIPSLRSFLRSKKGERGYTLLMAIIAVNVFAIMMLMARSMWETEITRDLEAELLFRAGQFRNAIELFSKKNNNLSPKNFEELYEKKFLRQIYEDPMSDEGKWNIVMQENTGRNKALLVVPEEMLDQYIARARIIGVVSTSPDEGFRTYRGKKRYSEWAVYVGEKPEKEMPELKFVEQ
ncbi:MAG: hypothetical protein GY765_32775 [bacterium]|nr:hypothetical protein [bacterium]